MTAILLIDFGAVWWQSYHAAQEDLGDAKRITVERIVRYASDHEQVAICCDSPYSLRRESFADYKKSREAKPPDVIAGLRETIARLKNDGFLVWESRGLEGDDVIATAVFQSENSGGDDEITIVSGDKDLLQLVTDKVRVKSTQTGNMIGPEEVENKLGVPPSQVVELLALWGDASDDIPGIPRVGQKTAAALLKEYGSVVGIFNAANDDTGKHPLLTPVIKENIRNSRETVNTGLELIALRRDAAIDFAEIFEERTVKVFTNREEESLKHALSETKAEIAQEAVAVTHAVVDRNNPTAERGVVTIRNIEQSMVEAGAERIIAAFADAKLLRTYIAKQLRRGKKDGEGDYGKVPGTSGKDTLFLSGAQKISAYYNVRPDYEVLHRERLPNGHVEYEIRCRLISRVSNEEVSSGLGSCSSMERKYRYRGAETEVTDQRIPKAYWDEEDTRRRSEMIGGKDFTAKKTDNGWFIARKTGTASENPDIADVHNTVLKMAKKRAYVDAVIALGCMAELFTQDLGDTYDIDGEIVE